MSVNKVILIGNVGKDPDVRYPQPGQPVASFSLATNERVPATTPGGTPTERTEWHNLLMWCKNAEVAERYVSKGMQLYVEGKLRYRIWEDKNQIKRTGAEVYVDNFQFLGKP